MALDQTSVAALADETRRNMLRAKIGAVKSARAEVRSTIALSNSATQAASDLARALSLRDAALASDLDSASAELAALESSAGPGVDRFVDSLSTTDLALRDERSAGKAAAVDYIKANPISVEADATAAYRTAALAARPPDRQWLLQDPLALRQEWTASLIAAGYLPDSTWESWRAFILATPRDTILSM